jgi:hypothetical protein
LGLIEVVITKAGETMQSPPGNSTGEPIQDGEKKTEGGTPPSKNDNAVDFSEGSSTSNPEIRPSEINPQGEDLDMSTSKAEQKIDPLTIFLHLPNDELCKLCLLLAQEGYALCYVSMLLS